MLSMMSINVHIHMHNVYTIKGTHHLKYDPLLTINDTQI